MPEWDKLVPRQGRGAALTPHTRPMGLATVGSRRETLADKPAGHRPFGIIFSLLLKTSRVTQCPSFPRWAVAWAGCVSPGHPAVPIPGTVPRGRWMAPGLARRRGGWPTWKGRAKPFLQVSSPQPFAEHCSLGPTPQSQTGHGHKSPGDSGISRAGKIISMEKSLIQKPCTAVSEGCLPQPASKAPPWARGCLCASHFPERPDPAWKASRGAGLSTFLGTIPLRATRDDRGAAGDGDPQPVPALTPCPAGGGCSHHQFLAGGDPTITVQGLGEDPATSNPYWGPERG